MSASFCRRVALGTATLAALFTALSCVSSSVREPENYQKLMSCVAEPGSDHNCVPVAEEFNKSLEIYKLDQKELLKTFWALEKAFQFSPDKSGLELKVILSRLSPELRTQDMATRVFNRLVASEEFLEARDFAAEYPQFKFEPVKQKYKKKKKKK